MNKLDRLREMIPFAGALYILILLAQVHVHHAPLSFASVSTDRARESLTWYFQQVAQSQRAETLAFSPGD